VSLVFKEGVVIEADRKVAHPLVLEHAVLTRPIKDQGTLKDFTDPRVVERDGFIRVARVEINLVCQLVQKISSKVWDRGVAHIHGRSVIKVFKEISVNVGARGSEDCVPCETPLRDALRGTWKGALAPVFHFLRNGRVSDDTRHIRTLDDT